MTQRTARRARGIALAISLALAAGAADARANPAAAQALFDEAKKLMAAGKLAEACPKFEESQKLDPGIGTQFNLASCYEQLGKTASAWSLFLEVAGAAKAAGQAEREKVARQRAAALEPKLARLSIAVPPEGMPPDLAIARDGVPVGMAQWGTPVPIDPGRHEVTATAAGKPPFRMEIDITEPGESRAVTIEFRNAPPAAGPRKDGGEAGPPDEPTSKTRRNSTGMMVTGIVLTSVGTLALVGGIAVVAVCNNKSGTIPEACNDNSTAGGLALGGLGLIGAGVGIPLMIVGARRVPVEGATASPTLLVSPQSLGVRWSM